jgi:oxygen-dependent protoporphyrinogen oxidase
MISDVIYTDKNAPSATNRYIYYPDHLVRLPHPLVDSVVGIVTSLLTEPIFKGFLPGLLGEAFREQRPDDLEDESVASFFSRRLHPAVAQNIVSAVLHGIYAGDVNQLSIRAIFPLLWHLEKEGGSVIGGLASRSPNKMLPVSRRDMDLVVELGSKLDPGLKAALAKASIFSFRNGIQQLADTLAESIQNNKRITMSLSTAVSHVALEDGSKQIKVCFNSSLLSFDTNHPAQVSSESESKSYDLVVSSLFSKKLSELCTSNSKTLLPDLAKTQAVTVMVVNLFYTNPKLLPVEGFGYLIPQSIPFQQNPERALGVIFDSDSIQGQDMATGTKLTVMLGGHWWDGWSNYPSEEEGIAAAKSILARHLNIKDEPVATHAKLQKDCIPQYKVGHNARLSASHKQILSEFKGRMRVVGNSYGGVGVNDCIRAAYDVAQDLGDKKTGLEHLFQPT